MELEMKHSTSPNYKEDLQEKQKLQWSPSSSLPLSSRNTDDRRHRRGWRSSSPCQGAPKLGNVARANATEHQPWRIYYHCGADFLKRGRREPRAREWHSGPFMGRICFWWAYAHMGKECTCTFASVWEFQLRPCLNQKFKISKKICWHLHGY